MLEAILETLNYPNHDFLFYMNINMMNTKAKFPLSSITKKKKTKEYSSDVQQQIVELHKI